MVMKESEQRDTTNPNISTIIDIDRSSRSFKLRSLLGMNVLPREIAVNMNREQKVLFNAIVMGKVGVIPTSERAPISGRQVAHLRPANFESEV